MQCTALYRRWNLILKKVYIMKKVYRVLVVVDAVLAIFVNCTTIPC